MQPALEGPVERPADPGRCGAPPAQLRWDPASVAATREVLEVAGGCVGGGGASCGGGGGGGADGLADCGRGGRSFEA